MSTRQAVTQIGVHVHLGGDVGSVSTSTLATTLIVLPPDRGTAAVTLRFDWARAVRLSTVTASPLAELLAWIETSQAATPPSTAAPDLFVAAIETSDFGA